MQSQRNFGAIQKFAPEEKIIAPQDKRFLMFNKLKPTQNTVFALDNPYRHHNDLGLLQ